MPETKRHLQLKDMALAWLRAIGCRAVASEVSCPFNRYRFDALGWLDHADDPRAVEVFGKPTAEARAPRVIAIECKQSRADFASDDKDPKELVRRKEYLIERRRVIEELRIKVREPHLRHAGSTLFESLDTWEFGASRIAAYRAVVTELASIDERLGIDTKFAMLARWRVADHLLVMAPHGLLRPREVPGGWGLVEVDPKALRKGWEPIVGEPIPCALRVAPAALGAPEKRRARLLRNIAVAASRGVGYGLTPPRAPATPTKSNAKIDGATQIDTPSLFNVHTNTSTETTGSTDTMQPPPSPGSSVG